MPLRPRALLPKLGRYLWQPFFCFFGAALHFRTGLSPTARRPALFPATFRIVSLLWNAGLFCALESGAHLSVWNTLGAGARAHLLPPGTYNQFYVVPGELTSDLRSYFFRRSDLMRQIEERDIEQLNDTPKR